MIRTVVGLRPFRPSGFVLRAEQLAGKTVVHDFGHGGGGVTLSWGTAALALEFAGSALGSRAAVLGCGAVGLATARLLQRRGVAVTIYARALPPETTSNIAGAHWSPFMVADREKRTPAFDLQMERAARIAHRAFQGMVGGHYGVRWTENYALHSERPTDSAGPLADLFPGGTVLGPGEHPFPTPYASRWLSMFIEPPIYLEAVLADVRLAGGRVEVRDLQNAAEVAALPEPIVFNCTGLGSKELFGDEELLPVKGQLTVLAPEPEVDYVMMKDDLYMFPRADGILLGGTHERGVGSLEPNLEAAKAVLEGHRAVFEGMR